MRLLCQAVVLLSVLCVSGWSDQVLYSNCGNLAEPCILGDPNSTTSAYNIAVDPINGVFDTFSTAFDSSMTAVSNIGLWVPSGDTPVSLSWSICFTDCVNEDGSQFGVVASGTNTTLSTSLFESGVQGPGGLFDIYSASFPVNAPLAAGSYELELYGAIDADSNSTVLWDVNNGPSTAYIGITGSPTSSNSFELDSSGGGAGDGGTAPEPGTSLALGSGLLAISLLTRRGFKKQ